MQTEVCRPFCAAESCGWLLGSVTSIEVWDFPLIVILGGPKGPKLPLFLTGPKHVIVLYFFMMWHNQQLPDR